MLPLWSWSDRLALLSLPGVAGVNGLVTRETLAAFTPPAHEPPLHNKGIDHRDELQPDFDTLLKLDFPHKKDR